MKKIELLAPAGDYNCFLAAISAGADAVYLSGDKFGARAYAKNFLKEELVRAIDYAHIFDKKVFMTVNTLLKDEEISELYDFLLPYYEAGLDGVIVQDIGVIAYIRRVFPELPVHASTQLAITGLEGFKLLERLGVKRTVLAREVSMAEIEYINNNSEMEIETFVHGALCYSYSGKCLFSSLAGGRSGNRGRCAGSCRQPYNGQYLLSTKDICCLSIIPEMINAGISSLKIEGRMKSPEYVAGVTSVYRKYIDYYYDNVSMPFDDLKKTFFTGVEFNKDKNLLTRLYTRGSNSEGYYYKNNGRDMITLLDASYKSDKGEVRKAFNESFVDNVLRKPVKALVRIYPGENISVIINNEYYFEGAEALYANNRPTDVETVKKQFNKTKDTEFYFSKITCDIAENAFVRISDLNELRRMALDGYREELLKSYRREGSSFLHSGVPDSSENNVKNDCLKCIKQEKSNNNRGLNCEILTKSQLDAVLLSDGIDGVYVPFNMLDDTVINSIKSVNKKLYVKFPSVIRHNFLLNNKVKIISLFDNIDGVLADSHEVIQFLLDNGFNKELTGDIHIYSLNREAYNTYRELGVDKLTIPVELNKKELLKMPLQHSELIIYGYLPMMVSAQCVNNTLNGCDKKGKLIYLKDRRGMEFKAVNMCDTCLNVIYNNVPLSFQGERDFINRINPESLRISFTLEAFEESRRVIDYFVNYLKKNTEINEPLLPENSFTKGHLNRGVL